MADRPAHLKPPAYLTPSTPAPKPGPAPAAAADPLGNNPVRYGDWELKGIAIDF